MTEEERFEAMQDWLMQAKREWKERITVSPNMRHLAAGHRLSVTKLANILQIEIYTDDAMPEGEYVSE